MIGYSFDHLLSISTSIGTFEHAEGRNPRREHGYCTDDLARVLVVASREPAPAPAVVELAQTAYRFVADAQDVDGKIRNRCDADGRWTDAHGVDDCWGRSLWGLGTAVRLGHNGALRRAALVSFERSAHQRSPHRRAMAFAALGAAEVLQSIPGHTDAQRLLIDAAESIGAPSPDPAWSWMEPRLSYANAAVAEALIAAGDLLGRADLLRDGMIVLAWLLERETIDGHLSPTPVGGSGPRDRAPGYDQQPIEVAAMADACSRASRISNDASWTHGLDAAVRWFGGANDLGVPMWDPASGGGFDGLTRSGPNQNQGAESTLAAISVLQHGERLASLGRTVLAASGVIPVRG